MKNGERRFFRLFYGERKSRSYVNKRKDDEERIGTMETHLARSYVDIIHDTHGDKSRILDIPVTGDCKGV